MKIFQCGISEILLPMFPSRTFIVSGLESLIHFEFILVYSVSWWSSFIFFACTSPDLPALFVEEAILLHFMLLTPLSNIN